MLPAMPVTFDYLTSILLVSCSPLAFVVLCYNYILITLSVQKRLWQRGGKKFFSRTILITGVSSPQGLQTARALKDAGHNIIGVDLKKAHLRIARFSRALHKYYHYPPQSTVQDGEYWAQCLLKTVRREGAEIWIDLESSLTTATAARIKAHLSENTQCACIAPNLDLAEKISTKVSFLEFLRERSLPAPESHRVKSRGEIHNILNQGQGKKQYWLQSADTPKPFDPRAILPRCSLSQTYHEVAMVKIASGTHVVLEEHLDTSITYTCNGIVVRGILKDFWTSRTRNDEISPESVPFALVRAFKSYLQAIAGALGSSATTHLSVTFCLIEKITVSGVVQQILPVNGGLQLDPDVVRAMTPILAKQVASAYLSVLDKFQNGYSSSAGVSMSSTDIEDDDIEMPTKQVYFFSNAVRDLIIKPSAQAFRNPRSARAALLQYIRFAQNILFNQDAYYHFFDPAPAFLHYLILEPAGTLFGLR